MRERTSGKRILAMLLSAAMLATSFPVQTIAAQEDQAAGTETSAAEITEAAAEDAAPILQEEPAGEQEGESQASETAEITETPVPEITEEFTEPSVVLGEEGTEITSTPVPEVQEETVIQTADATIVVAWDDCEDIAGRRPSDLSKLFRVYADGNELGTKPTVTLQKEPEETDGIWTYTYAIEDLPVTAEDGVTPIAYTVRQSEEALKGYTLTPEQVTLSLGEDGLYRADKSFANVLPTYQAAGTVAWQLGDMAERPELEEYFQSQFTILRNGDSGNYTAYRIHYEQDETDGSVWNYNIEGLFTTMEDGSAASYTLCAENLEGFTLDAQERTVDADSAAQGTPGYSFTYTQAEEPAEPTAAPTETPTEPEPTVTPTEVPTEPEPTVPPTEVPTEPEPTVAPTEVPALTATPIPTETPEPEEEMTASTLRMRAASVTRTAAETGDQSMTVVWYPSNTAVRDAYAGELGAGMTLAALVAQTDRSIRIEFSVENDASTYDLLDLLASSDGTEVLKERLGLDDAQIEELKSKTIIRSTTGTFDVFSIETLPVSVHQDTGEEETDEAVSWSITESWAEQSSNTVSADGATYTFLQAEHHDAYQGQNNVYVHKQDAGFQFVLEILDKDAPDPIDTAAEVLALIQNQLQTYAQYGGSGYAAVPGADGSLQITIDGHTYTAAVNIPETIPGGTQGITVSLSGLPMYTESDEEIIYFVQALDTQLRGNLPSDDPDYYAVTYDNKNAVNFGSNTTETHEGGLLRLTLTGTTAYSATKIWLDDEKQSRPATTWTLWRYSNVSGADYTTAAAVYDDNGDQIRWTDIEGENEATYSTEEFAAVLGNGLPKYDTEGNRYIYLVRETMSGGDNYAKVYGTVEEDGTVTGDLSPDGSAWDAQGRGSDPSLYNDGILSNRREENISVETEKTWIAKAHQSELENVFVELTLNQKNTEGQWVPAKDGDGNAIIEYLTGFQQEIMTKSISKSMPRFDAFGQPVEYKWTETGIYEAGEADYANAQEKKQAALKAGNLLDAKTNTFTLSHNLENGEVPSDGREWYESTEDEQGNIVNTLKGETHYIIQKKWYGEDGQELTGDEIPAGAQVSWQLSKNEDTGFMSGTLDGETDSIETQSWTAVITGLDKFDEAGVKNEYVAIEADCAPEEYNLLGYEYNTPITVGDITYTTNTVIVSNGLKGLSKIINVRKQWIDDGDSASRMPVKVQIWRKADGKNPARLLNTVNLTEAGDWWKRVNVTEFMDARGVLYTRSEWMEKYPDTPPVSENLYTSGSYYLKEIGIGSDGVPCSSMSLEDPEADYETSGDQDQGRYMGTSSQIYYIDYVVTEKDGSDGSGYYTVTNRRIGVVNLTVTKTWTDGGQTAAARAALGAQIELICTDADAADRGISIKADSVVANSGGGAALAELDRTIQGPDQSETGSVQTLTGGDGGNTETLYFYNLPKYDENGAVIHYFVREIHTEALEAADYVTAIEDSGYIVGAQHTNDRQSLAVENKRSAAESVKFHKLWKDSYRYRRGERPDIYLTLYCYNSGTGEMEPTGYRDMIWTRSDSDSAYRWTCEIPGLARYDAQGNELIYYASEGMQVDYTLLDYLDVQYMYDGQYVSEKDEDGQITYTPNEDSIRAYTGTASSISLLKEDGTFVNALASTVAVSGKKVWRNTPSGLALEDYPNLQISLWQTQSLDKVNWDGEGTDPLSTADGDAVVAQLNTHDQSQDGKYTITNNGVTVSFRVTAGTVDSYSGQKLPQYDENGRRYYYAIRETVLNADGEPIGDGDSLNTAYVKLPGTVNAYVITNTYDITGKNAVGTVNIKKTWDVSSYTLQPDDYDNLPNTTFTLYRCYKSYATGENTAWEAVKSITLNKDEITENKWEAVFENQLLYAPNGEAYTYFIRETDLAGYEEYGQGETKTTDSETFQLVSSETVTVTDNTVTKTFTNKYEPDTLTLSGKKIWNDFNNMSSTRESKANFYQRLHLYRYTGTPDESVGSDAMNWQEVTLQDSNSAKDAYFAWGSDADDGDSWSYTISGLDRYAPNGTAWEYALVEGEYTIDPAVPGTETPALTENVPDGYIGAITSVNSVGKHDSSGAITGMDLTNQEYKSASFTKVWDDGQGESAIRPSSIKVNLQFKIDGESKWQYASMLNFRNAGIMPGSVNNLLQVKWNGSTDSVFASAYNAGTFPVGGPSIIPFWTISAQSSPSWSLTLDYLPAFVNVGGVNKEISWRFLETDIGDMIVHLDVFITIDNVLYLATGSYQPSQTGYEVGEKNAASFGTDKTEVTNKLLDTGKTSLTVEKTWEDHSNLYGNRPLTEDGKWQVTVQLERADSRYAGDENAWSAVKDENGKPVTKTITGSDATSDSGKVEFANLPVKDGTYTSAEVAVWVYRATEVSSPELENYATVCSGTSASDNKTTAITNTLVSFPLTVTKEWKAADGTALNTSDLPAGTTVTLELKRYDGTTEVPFPDPVTVELDGTADSGDGLPLNHETGAWQATFQGLVAGYYDSESEFHPYTYKAVEAAWDSDADEYISAVTPGFWKTEGTLALTASDAGTTEARSVTVTNTRNSFYLEKMAADDEGNAYQIPTDYETVYQIKADDKLAATWSKTCRQINGEKKYTYKVESANGDFAVVEKNAEEPVSVEGLPAGTYILHEAAAPNGYCTADDIEIEIGVDGSVKLADGVTNTQAVLTGSGTGNQTVTLLDRPIQINLKKVTGSADIDSEEFGYAVFNIRGYFADNPNQEAVKENIINKMSNENVPSGYNAISSLDGLWIAGNTYTFTEIKAPDGYERSDGEVRIKITEEGRPMWLSGDNAFTATTDDGIYYIFVRNKPIELELVKQDSDSNLLSGAEFKLEDTTQDLPAEAVKEIYFTCTNSTITTKVSGVDFDGVAAEMILTQGHTYTLTEVKAPTGYILPQTDRGIQNLSAGFTVNTDGTVTPTNGTSVVNGANGGTITFSRIEEDTPRISVTNDPVKLTLTKVDKEDDTEKLAGAQFSLYKGASAAGTSVLSGLTTDTDGVLVITTGTPSGFALETTADPSDTASIIWYTLHETKAPSGYKLLTSDLTFYITTAGKMVFADNTADSYTLDPENSANFTVKNEKTCIGLLKQGCDQYYLDGSKATTITSLSGAKLTISDSEGAVVTWEATGRDQTTVTKISQAEKYAAVDTSATDGTISGLPAGTYTLSETETPEGYLTIPDTEFTILTDGTLRVDSQNGRPDNITGTTAPADYVVVRNYAGSTPTMYVTDFRIRGDVFLRKYLDDENNNQTLTGVTFDLYQTNASHTAEGVKLAENLETSPAGYMKLSSQSYSVVFLTGEDEGKSVKSGLRAGEYYLVESGATADSVLDSTSKHYFTIKGDSQNPGQQPAQVWLGAVENAPFSAGVTFQKVDSADGRPVSGVEFKLFYIPDVPYGLAQPYDGGTGHTYTTDEEGRITITGLTKGFYGLTETAAEGYELGGQVFRAMFYITESDNGKTQKLDALASDNADDFTVISGSYEASTGSTDFLIKNTRQTGSISILKQNNDDTPEALNGAEFQLTKVSEANGDAVNLIYEEITFVSGKAYKADGSSFTEDTDAPAQDGMITITGLDWGTYTLTETKAPAGYKLEDQTVTFEITREDRDLTALTDGRKVINVRTSLALQKAGADGTTLLPGAVFTLAPMEGSAFAGGETQITLDGSSQLSDGRWSLEGVLIGGDTYVLTEATAPEGYELGAPVYFTISERGGITIVDGQGGTPEDTDASAAEVSGQWTLTVKDTPITASVVKTDRADDTERLAGAVFALYDLGTDGLGNTEVTDGVTGRGADSGIYDLSGLVQGHQYKLVELAAPEGYQLPDAAADKPYVIFTVGTDGTLAVNGTDSTTGFCLEGTGTDQLTLGNDKTSLKIAKTNSETGLPLSGAGLQILDQSGAPVREWITGSTAELIEGLAAGDYTLHEESTPDGYVTAEDIAFTLNSNNTITATGADAAAVTDNGDGSYTVTMTDVVIRGDVRLHKTLEGAGDLDGAVFSLYKADGTLVAEGLTTGENGIWTSQASDAVRMDKPAAPGEAQETLAAGLEKGSYYFLETAVPQNTKLDAQQRWEFTIDANGKEQPAVKLVEVTNQLFNATVVFTKTEDEAHGYAAVEGANFALYYDADGAIDAEHLEGLTPIRTGIATGTDGKAVVENLRKGYYLLVETGATGYGEDSYYMGSFRIVEADADKTLDLTAATGDGAGRMTDAAGLLVSGKGIVNTRLTGTVKLNKVDSEDTSKVLSGVTFRLDRKNDAGEYEEFFTGLETGRCYDASSGSLAEGMTADTEGTLIIEKLDWGDYRLVETATVAGYENHKTELEFAITREGSKEITVRTGVDANGRPYVENTQNELIIRKTDKADTQLLLPGAVFTITDAQSGEVLVAEQDGTVGSTGETLGILRVKGILVGGREYILHEVTAPEGYELAGDIRFTMKEDGTAEIDGEALADNVLSVEDEKIQITLTKHYGELTGEVLQGITYELTGVEIQADGQTLLDDRTDSFTTDETGTIVITGDSLKQNYVYQLQETTAKDDLYQAEAAVTVVFRVNTDGTVTCGTVTDGVFAPAGDNPYFTGSGTDTLTAVNTPVAAALSIEKVNDVAQEALAGAVFRLTYEGIDGVIIEDNTPQTVCEMTTAEDGIVHFENLIKGNYILEEIANPDGYALPEEERFTAAFQVTDENNGATLTLDDMTVEKGIIEDGKIVNRQTSITVQKTDDNGAALSGAVFSIRNMAGEELIRWTSDGTPYTIRGLLTVGESYILSELTPPEGYHVAEEPDITFVLDESGVAEFTIEDKEIRTATEVGSVKLTKVVTYQNRPVAMEASYYAALFADEGLTQRVSAVTELALDGQYSATSIISNLPYGTYYVAETDEYGNLYDGAGFMQVSIDNDVVDITASQPEGAAVIHNSLQTTPGHYYDVGTLTVTKQVTKEDKAVKLYDSTFYVTLFADAEHTMMVSSPEALEIDGVSSTAVTFEDLAAGTYYIAETDRDGNPVDDSADDFYFNVTISEESVTVQGTTDANEVTLTNALKENYPGTYEYEDPETTPTPTGGTAQTTPGAAANSIQTSAAKTGDDSHAEWYFMLLLISALGCGLILQRKRKQNG